jgi:4-amino-4-deoxy-L-arabinose transferase-like glycosyltransferase
MISPHHGTRTDSPEFPLSPSSTMNTPREVKWLLVIGCGLRIIFFYFSQNNGGDAFARAAVAVNWLSHPSFNLNFGGPTWPPLHFWLMALVAQVVPNVLLACRLLSLIAGLISLWLFWKLALRLVGKNAAIVSLAIFTLYPLHIAYTTTSSSEATFIALVLGGLLCICTFGSSRNYSTLATGGFLLTAAAAIRFEAWILIIGLGIVFLVGREGRRIGDQGYWNTLLAYSIPSGAWPIFWTIHEWVTTGHPLYALSSQHSSVPAQLAFYPGHGWLYELALIPGVILLTLTPLTLAGTIYGLYLSWRLKKNRGLVFLLLFFAAFQLETIATHGSIAMARYTLTLGTFCALFAGYGLLQLGQQFLSVTPSAVRNIMAVLMAANLAFILWFSTHSGPFEDKFRSISPLMPFQVHIKTVAKFLRPKIRPEDRLVIDSFNDESNLVAAALGLPLLPGDRAFIPSNSNRSGPFQFFSSAHPRFAVLAGRGTFGSQLSLPFACSTTWWIQDMQFRCVFENEIYRVYEMDYKSPASQ